MGQRGPFAVWLRETRGEKGETQDVASTAIGVHQVTYARWETGARAPRLHLLRPIAAWAGVDAGELLLML